MDRTADNSTPQIPEATGYPLPWDEALKRAGSFDKLRPYLHTGQILACHGGLYTLSDGKRYSGPGMFAPEKWFVARTDRAGRVIFITEPVVMDGRVVQEEVFAYASSIKFDSVAFDAFFPVAGLPPAEHPRSLTTQAEPVIADPAPTSAVPPVNSGGRPTIRLFSSLGGRPTDRDLVLEEADWRLRHQQVSETLAAFARELHAWLEDHGMHRAAKTGKVMKVETIEDHVRSLWNAHKRA